MILLDMRTIVFGNVVPNIVCMLVILLLWHQSRKRFAGTGFWVFDYAFQTVALFLIILRGSIPDWTSMVLSNTLVIAGALLGYMGLGRFVGKKISQVHNYVLLTAFACIQAYFALVQPNLAARNLNLSVGLLIICFQCMWLLMHRVERGMRQLTLGVGMVFGAYCLLSIVRIVAFFIETHSRNDYFQPSGFEPFVLVSYEILFILLTYSLVLMFNKRLLVDVKTQEEKFSKAFHSSPYAITLTRFSDGQIIEVNDGFVNITGYQYAEIMRKTTADLQLWDKEEDRVVVVNELSKSGKVKGREFQFRKKSGEMIIGLFSAEIIPINNHQFVLTSISDITERKRAEETLSETKQMLVNIAMGITDGIVAITKDFKIIWANEEVLRMSGRKMEEIVGNYCHKVTHHSESPCQPPHDICPVREVIHTGNPVTVTHTHFDKEGNELFVEVSAYPIKDEKGEIIQFVHLCRDVTERKRAEVEREKLIKELEEALAKVKTLSGFLPICMSCKKIRDDKGYWEQIEVYIRDRSEAEFSHGICPDCMKKLYPDESLEDL